MTQTPHFGVTREYEIMLKVSIFLTFFARPGNLMSLY